MTASTTRCPTVTPLNLVEAQANASVYDGGVFIASCDKSVPAMLMSIGRRKHMRY